MGKKLFAAIVAGVLLLSFSSCHMVFVDEDKDLAQVVATINDAEITKEDVMAIYDTYRYNYDLTPENQTTDEYIDTYQAMLKEIYEMLIEYHLILQYGEQYASVELTDEMRESIDKNLETVAENITSSIEEQVGEEAAEDPTMDVDAEIAARLAARLEYRGVSTGEYKTRLEIEAIMDVVSEEIKAGYAPTNENIEEYYNEELESQQELIEEDITNYDYLEAYYINLYVPAGFRYVKNLLIALPDDVQDAIAALRSDGNDGAADALRDTELAKIYDEAESIYTRIQGGEEYDALLAEYGEDPGMKEGAFYAETGYRLYEGISGYEENFLTAAFALENVGDVSEPIASDYGYYFLKFMSVSEAHDVPIEDVWDQIEAELIADKAEDLYDEVIENWKRQADITEYKERLYE